jgi:disulfide bond formation protein DsbB
LKTLQTLISTKGRLCAITLLSSIALFSSLYLQYVSLYQPCKYCLILRYLTAGILVVSFVGYVRPNLVKDIAALESGAGLVGVGVSTLLIIDELFPATGICTSCSFSPPIMGVSLYYYSFTYMALVLALSISIALKKEEGS